MPKIEVKFMKNRKRVKLYIIYTKPYFNETQIFTSLYQAEKYYKNVENKTYQDDPIWLEQFIEI